MLLFLLFYVVKKSFFLSSQIVYVVENRFNYEKKCINVMHFTSKRCFCF